MLFASETTKCQVYCVHRYLFDAADERKMNLTNKKKFYIVVVQPVLIYVRQLVLVRVPLKNLL